MDQKRKKLALNQETLRKLSEEGKREKGFATAHTCTTPTACTPFSCTLAPC